MGIIKKFEYADGYRQTVPAQVSGEVCDQLASEGRLTAENLIEVSRPEDAPTHAAFEWRDDVAAEEWRKHQARTLIANLRIVVEEADNRPIKAFFNLQFKEPEYTSLEVILNDEEKTAQMLSNALRELTSFRTKYSTLKELAGVFSAVDQLRLDIGE